MSKRGLKFIVFVQCLLFLSLTNLFKTEMLNLLFQSRKLPFLKKSAFPFYQFPKGVCQVRKSVSCPVLEEDI